MQVQFSEHTPVLPNVSCYIVQILPSIFIEIGAFESFKEIVLTFKLHFKL